MVSHCFAIRVNFNIRIDVTTYSPGCSHLRIKIIWINSNKTRLHVFWIWWCWGIYDTIQLVLDVSPCCLCEFRKFLGDLLDIKVKKKNPICFNNKLDSPEKSEVWTSFTVEAALYWSQRSFLTHSVDQRTNEADPLLHENNEIEVQTAVNVKNSLVLPLMLSSSFQTLRRTFLPLDAVTYPYNLIIVFSFCYIW